MEVNKEKCECEDESKSGGLVIETSNERRDQALEVLNRSEQNWEERIWEGEEKNSKCRSLKDSSRNCKDILREQLKKLMWTFGFWIM